MLFDTNAWIEFFDGTPKGAKVRELLKQERPAVATATLAEVTSWCLRRGFEPQRFVRLIEKNSSVLALTPYAASQAGEIHFRNKKIDNTFGMVDAMIYATALNYGLKLVTGDKHFEGKPGVVFV